MKKNTLTLFFVLLGIVVNAQKFKVLKEENKEGGLTSYKLDCSKGNPLLAYNLKYTINKDVFESKNKQDVYYVTLLLKGAYESTLNKELTISTIFEDGTIVTNK